MFFNSCDLPNFAGNMQVSPKFKAWLKRVGWIGFFFFLIKGIIWLIAGKVLLEWISEVF